LLRQIQTLTAVFVTVGGGGLISGIASYLKQLNPNIEIYGCLPNNARAMHESILAGKIVEFMETPTLSDGSAGGLEPGAITFELCAGLIDHTILVTENEIRQAMKLIAEQERWIIEGAAGVAVAAYLQRAPSMKGHQAAIVLCGRNVDWSTFDRAVKGSKDF
jgi:threonine dehydratase